MKSMLSRMSEKSSTSQTTGTIRFWEGSENSRYECSSVTFRMDH